MEFVEIGSLVETQQHFSGLEPSKSLIAVDFGEDLEFRLGRLPKRAPLKESLQAPDSHTQENRSLTLKALMLIGASSTPL